MKSKKGQALVEFIMILPIFLMLIFCVIDLGRIISVKLNLENLSNDVITFYENGSNKEEIKELIIKKEDKVDLNINEDEGYTKIELKKSLKPITPGFNLLPDEVFETKVTRVFKESNIIITTSSGDNYE